MDCRIIIAELGSSPAPAWDFEHWLERVAFTGAEAVKVQLFRAGHFPLSEQAAKAELEFPRHRWGEFIYRAHAAGLQAGASVFDVDALRQVLEYGDFIKVAAREETNGPLLSAIANENAHAARSLAGRHDRLPVYRSVTDPRVVRRGYPFDLGDVVLLTLPHYPASLSAALLKVCLAASSFRDRAWGWSSHTPDILDCWLAAKLGAAVIEKHFAMTGTELEAPHSLTPMGFKEMVRRCT